MHGREEDVAVDEPTAAIRQGDLPAEYVVNTLDHPSLGLCQPLRLRVEQENEFVTVWNEDLEELGYGTDLLAAVADFQDTVTELYCTLRDEQAQLGPAMARLWRQIQLLVEERS
jgi:hypothetical protein